MQVEGEVAAMKKALCILLAAIFVCCVVFYGENERFSLEAFLNNITKFEDMPSIEKVTEIWTLPYYDDSDLGFGSDPEMTKIYFEDYDGDNPVLEFFDGVRGFFRRLTYSIKLVVRIMMSVFKNLKYLLPWNSTVPKEV